MRDIGNVNETRTNESGKTLSERIKRKVSGILDTDQLGSLTVGELFVTDRRRKGENQEQTAVRFGISRNFYGRVERDEISHKGIPLPDIDRLEPYEKCFLYRRRARKTQEQCAHDMKISRQWLDQMELGNVSCEQLIWYWEC